MRYIEMRVKKKQKTIALTEAEYAMVDESKELFGLMTGVKMSWGAYITALSLGALAAKSLNGLLIRCTNCGQEVEMELHIIKKREARKLATSKSSELHNQIPKASV
jgi:hypothetical protein